MVDTSDLPDKPTNNNSDSDRSPERFSDRLDSQSLNHVREDTYYKDNHQYARDTERSFNRQDYVEPTQDQLAQYRAGDIDGAAKESIAGNNEITEDNVYDYVALAKEQGVLNQAISKIEEDGKASVVRDKDGTVKELLFDNDNPYDDTKVSVRFDGDKVTVNDKSKEQLDKQERDEIGKFYSAEVNNPERRLRDGSKLTDTEKEMVLGLETSLLNGDLKSLEKLAPSLLKDKDTANRVLEAVDSDMYPSPLSIIKGADGKDMLFLTNTFEGITVNEEGESTAVDYDSWSDAPPQPATRANKADIMSDAQRSATFGGEMDMKAWRRSYADFNPGKDPNPEELAQHKFDRIAKMRQRE